MSSQAPKQLPQDDLIGRVINDRFRILSVVARGGMGRVYRAEQVPLGRLVAIKTLDPRHAGTSENDPQFQQRFFLEASVASKLQHPNTVTVFDYGRTADGIYFIAMELVEGRSLLAAIRAEAPFSAPRVVHIALQIARSLREAHRLDVIHRDLKPGNVLLTQHGDEDDFVKVLDFGLVKHVETEQQQELTKAGLFMGSPKYMSPEQIRGDRVDARADVYALGVCMYEMLTGRVPFDRENTVKILMAHMHEMVPSIENPDVPTAMVDLVMRCLSKSPDGRPASMDEVILLLKQATGGPTLHSGAFPLSGEIRLGGGTPGVSSSGRLVAGTPSQPFVAGTHPMVGTPSAGFSVSGSRSSLMPQMTNSQAFPISGAQPGMMPSHPPQPPASSGWFPRVAVIGALAIAGGFLALRFSEHQQTISAAPPGAMEAKPAAAQGTATSSATQVPVAPKVEVPQAHVFVRLTSNPSGARVLVDGKPYGPTPADIELWGEIAEKGNEVTFLFEKEGFESVSVQRRIQDEKFAVDAALSRDPATIPRRREPARSSESRKSTGPVVVTPDNFKEDPY
jgi:serine/threonine-protein kinase